MSVSNPLPPPPTRTSRTRGTGTRFAAADNPQTGPSTGAAVGPFNLATPPTASIRDFTMPVAPNPRLASSLSPAAPREDPEAGEPTKQDVAYWSKCLCVFPSLTKESRDVCCLFGFCSVIVCIICLGCWLGIYYSFLTLDPVSVNNCEVVGRKDLRIDGPLTDRRSAKRERKILPRMVINTIEFDHPDTGERTRGLSCVGSVGPQSATGGFYLLHYIDNSRSLPFYSSTVKTYGYNWSGFRPPLWLCAQDDGNLMGSRFRRGYSPVSSCKVVPNRDASWGNPWIVMMDNDVWYSKSEYIAMTFFGCVCALPALTCLWMTFGRHILWFWTFKWCGPCRLRKKGSPPRSPRSSRATTSRTTTTSTHAVTLQTVHVNTSPTAAV